MVTEPSSRSDIDMYAFVTVNDAFASTHIFMRKIVRIIDDDRSRRRLLMISP